MGRGRQQLADAVGLSLILAVLLDLLRPSLLLLPTIAAGGDTPCHYPTFVWLKERLLPEWRLHGWYPGTYLGQPLLLYYFPFPFVLMSALAPLVGEPAAFKLGTALGVFLLPLWAYVSLRRMRAAFPAPLLAAAAALVFLYVEQNPIWGGTLASTLTGEFSYTYGIGFALLFLGELQRAREDGRGPWLPALLLALTAYAHGYAVLWAGLTASGLLLWDRRPLRALGWLAGVASLAFALAAPMLLPLLGDWGWTTPYDDAWIDVTTRGLLPPLLWPFAALAAVGLAWQLLRWRARDPLDTRLALLLWGTLAGAALVSAGPALGVIDVRFAPLAQLSLAVAGSYGLGLLASRLALADLAAVGLTLLSIAHADAPSQVLRSWIDWNYSGLEAKELWPAWRTLCDRIRGDTGAPRVAVEYDPLHERAGSLRMYEMLAFFSGRSTLEGVYNQASTTTHPVYYLASELFARSPNPFRSRNYSRFDPGSAVPRLRTFAVDTIVATSPALIAALAARPDVRREALIPPYVVYRLTDPGPGYVEPLAFEPVRLPIEGWQDSCYRWFTRKPANRAHLVFTSDRRFALTPADPWAAPPERPLPAGVQIRSRLGTEAIQIETSRPGHPLLVKISFHPRWRAEGAAGPYLVSPGLMLVVPTRRSVRLFYQGRTLADWMGLGLAAAGLAVVGFSARQRRPGPAAGDLAPAPCVDSSRERRAALRVFAPALILLLAGLRLLPRPPRASDAGSLHERSRQAYAAQRWQDAAELARHAGESLPAGDARRAELACIQGEALHREGHPREAAAVFAALLDTGAGPHTAQALYSGSLARAAAGDEGGAASWRHQLRATFPDSTWARRLGVERE